MSYERFCPGKQGAMTMEMFDVGTELSLRQVLTWPIDGQAPGPGEREGRMAPCSAGDRRRCDEQLETIIELLEALLATMTCDTEQEGPSRTGPCLEACGPARSYGLTPREEEVLAEMVEGKSNRQIAGVLTVSVATIKSHVSSILAKMGAASRTEAATMALQQQADIDGPLYAGAGTPSAWQRQLSD